MKTIYYEIFTPLPLNKKVELLNKAIEEFSLSKWALECNLVIVQVLFVDMFFGGNFPFGFHQQHPDQDDEDAEQSDEQQSYYDLLDCRPDAPLQEITQKYEALLEKHSPGGSEPDDETVQQLKQAYEVLSDPQKRRMYDMTQQGGQGGLFDMMFGGQGGKGKKGQQQERPKMQPTKRVLQITLEQAFLGSTVDLHHEHARLCASCEGKGGENVKKCAVCKGQGGVVQLVQVAPGMYSQMEKDCENCKGMGELFDEGVRCKDCEGRKIVKKEVQLKVPVPPGVPAGEILTIEGQGNEVPEASAGDLLLVVQETPHPSFTRKGADLYFKKNITLVQALLGFNFKLPYLDGRSYTIYTRAGEVVGDHDKKVVRGLGMPFFKNEEHRGNLIVEFTVTMPKRGELTAPQLAALRQVLPGVVNPRPVDSNYEMLEDFEKQHLNSSEQGGKKKDDEQEGEEQGIGCQAQ